MSAMPLHASVASLLASMGCGFALAWFLRGHSVTAPAHGPPADHAGQARGREGGGSSGDDGYDKDDDFDGGGDDVDSDGNSVGDDTGSDDDDDADADEHKMVLVVRADLKMGKGKAAAQCAHAAVAAYRLAAARQPGALRRWRRGGQAKIVTRVEDEAALLELQERARALGLGAPVVCDAGRTQVAAGSCTVLAVGPGPVRMVGEVTGHLKLY
ncbi:peptidyl-tRNA hydrolase 2, mitochondrial-like isoform X2 [Petromyzon marinus]|nr:peptidyl-tRNA hydrolase 2, mitochondrial-like isoform X2 [Petromyzon marinus]XP_032825198.1 peptidyl-tRNA hydrolase 2, mitochondrial-like isoform X2 [Petromyzon marinus]XP_032825199.1 peptidyl-tRNA hydrolase 2, mitochondrial-like isoform X2 [Petromyzon marinus]XP_032825200.1 peptidyl-tRNA hydrolase 2, mitochondrial-like isoform X2 [Petromyzon marinus]